MMLCITEFTLDLLGQQRVGEGVCVCVCGGGGGMRAKINLPVFTALSSGGLGVEAACTKQILQKTGQTLS